MTTYPAPARIVPTQTLVGRAFVFVIAIMTFLACLCVGISACVVGTVNEWDSRISRDITVQIRPIDGVDIENSIKTVLELARATKGIKNAQPISDTAQKELLAPWLSDSVDVSILALPRLVAIEIAPKAQPNISALSQVISAKVQGVSIDDHRVWRDRLQYSATLILGACAFIFMLIVLAAALTIAFATQGTLASSRHVVEILDMLGAPHSFIAGEFQKEYFRFGLKGAALGGLAATAIFAGLDIARILGSMPDIGLIVPITQLSIGIWGYIALLGAIIFVALLTALISRFTTLAIIDDSHFWARD